jgi:anaphase-promoting complex subunit 5
MARHLTPSKIGLLALISLYSESVVPNVSSIAILSFVVDFLLPVQSGISHPKPGSSISPSIEDFQNATITHASAVPGRTIWDLFLRKLWLIDTFDELHVFFDSLSELLVKSHEQQQQDLENGFPPPNPEKLLLSRKSPLGTFVRRTQLEFVRIQLHDSMNLWRAFIVYRQSTLPMWRKRNSNFSNRSFDINLLGDGTKKSGILDVVYGGLMDADPLMSGGAISTDDVEKLLEFQVKEMQSEYIYIINHKTAKRSRNGKQSTRPNPTPTPENHREQCDGPESLTLCQVSFSLRAYSCLT